MYGCYCAELSLFLDVLDRSKFLAIYDWYASTVLNLLNLKRSSQQGASTTMALVGAFWPYIHPGLNTSRVPKPGHEYWIAATECGMNTLCVPQQVFLPIDDLSLQKSAKTKRAAYSENIHPQMCCWCTVLHVLSCTGGGITYSCCAVVTVRIKHIGAFRPHRNNLSTLRSERTLLIVWICDYWLFFVAEASR